LCITMLRSKQFAMYFLRLRPLPMYLFWVALAAQLFRRTAQRVTTQRPSLLLVGLEVRLFLGIVDNPQQDVYHLLQHRLSLAQPRVLRPALIAMLALSSPLDPKVRILSRPLKAPLPPFTLLLFVVWATTR